MDETFPLYFGCWIYIDPDEELIELIELELDLEVLCELLRCDATDVIELTDGLWGYIDGEGAWQERQTEWYFQGRSCWGPMLIFHLSSEQDAPGSCSEEELTMVEEKIQFF